MSAATKVTLDELVRRGRCERAVPLAPLTTYRFGGPAAYFCEPTDVGELREVLAAATSAGKPLLVLGRGSNVVVSDQGFDGVVVRPGGRFTDLEIDGAGVVTAGAAVPLPRLARESVRAGRGGLEWYVGIPGSVGGAVRMNAGGHGGDTAAWLLSASVLDAASGSIQRRTPADLDLSYRHSNLGPDDVVVEATFHTIERDPDDGNRLLRAVTQWRREHQPGGTLNAGSVFKNPPGDSAGRLIDALGLKGFRCGGASVSRRHANFFVAEGDATAQDVYDLVAEVRRRVAQATGTHLETEVRFIGPFEETGPEPGDDAGRPA